VRENQTIIRCDVCDHLPTVDVARVRITDAGRRELAERAKQPRCYARTHWVILPMPMLRRSISCMLAGLRGLSRPILDKEFRVEVIHP
jgi:hypothetical protein